MAPPLLQTVSWAFALVITLIAILALGRGITHLWRVISIGQPAPGRIRPVGRRAWTLVTTALSHREFKGRLAVKIAHWIVMVSFVLLILTLVSGYANLRNQLWSLPIIGHWAPWEWTVEILAWGGIIAILTLMVIRTRAGSGRPGEAELSLDPSTPPSSTTPYPRDGSPRGLASRFLGSTRWQARFVEWVILLVCACVVALRGLEYALYSTEPVMDDLATWVHFPLTAWLGGLLSEATPTALASAIVIVSLFKIVVSMSWMIVVGTLTSMGVAWHRFLAIVNLYARRDPKGGKALGPAAPMIVDGSPVTDFDSIPDDSTLGVGSAEDLSWKARLDLYSCTECGRCQELCPAWNTQKPLSPKLLVLAMRDHVHSASNMEIRQVEVTDREVPGGGVVSLAEGAVLIEKGLTPTPHTGDVRRALKESGAAGPLGVSDVAAPLVPGVVTEDVLWDCTMCGACVDQCPVDIEHVDHILDLRRHQVLMESAFPRELGRAFRGMETKANPYNQPARKRLDWAKSLDFDVPIIGQDIDSAQEVDYLFWVGCAGAYDDRAKATAAAVAELLHIAGVSFGVLGSGESCTGDPARRAGNEVLFQLLAGAAIETLTEAHAQKIVVTCAHCFNTIAGEFPQLGGHFEVIHHTQLLNRLIREGKLRPAPATTQGGGVEAPQSITYHDPCFLGRHNQVYEPPRELLGSVPGLELVEMPRNRDRAMCCGAGGARAWMEETQGIRIADARMAEAATTGASVVATACPFCSQMLGSATGASSPEFTSEDLGLPQVRDVALMLLDGVRRGAQGAESGSDIDEGGALD